MSHLIKPCRKIKGSLNLPGDKSISHRAIILSSIANGLTQIKNLSFSDDCNATLKAFRSLGVKIRKGSNGDLFIYGVGLFGLKRPKKVINVCESGTSMRILLGLLCAQNFDSKLDGKTPLRRRPMLRVVKPLRLMGANIKAKKKSNDEYPPISIYPSGLRSLNWKMSIPSAQVKSAILLAGLYASGKTKIYEPIKSRDHTERMLRHFQAKIKQNRNNIIISPSNLISPKTIYVPSDISSAAFFIVLGCLLKDSIIRIKNLGLNPSRVGLIDVLKRMGAKIKIVKGRNKYFEPTADVVIKSSRLKSVKITKDKIPSLIDELPVLMVAASLAKGISTFQGVRELRVKETDRIKSMIWNLSRMGVKLESQVKNNEEIVMICGNTKLNGANLKSFDDHRTAMSMIIAGLLADSPSKIDDVKCINKSFPEFLKTLNRIIN